MGLWIYGGQKNLYFTPRAPPQIGSNRASTTRQLNSATASAGRSFYSKQFIALCWLGTGTAINQT